MFYDLTSVYCWSPDNSARAASKAALEPFLQGNKDAQNLCENLVSYGWDTLRIENDRNNFSPPLKIVQIDESAKFENLRKSWVNFIIEYPQNYIKTKLIFVGEIISMGNIFNRNSSWVEFQSPLSILNSLVKLPLLILDKLYLFTILGFLLIIWFIKKFNMDLSIFILVLLLNSTIVYVANNGRYLFGFLLLATLLTENQKSISSINEKV